MALIPKVEFTFMELAESYVPMEIWGGSRDGDRRLNSGGRCDFTLKTPPCDNLSYWQVGPSCALHALFVLWYGCCNDLASVERLWNFQKKKKTGRFRNPALK